MADAPELIFGYPEQWGRFREQHPLFIERLPNLRSVIEIGFSKRATRSRVDFVVYFLGRTCVEEFFETLLLAGNGYGIAALRTLRGMYERVVTATYLHRHPEKTDDFLDYHWVQQHKLTEAIKKTFGEAAVPTDRLRLLEEHYDQIVRDKRFVITACENCGKEKLNHTWSKLDFVSMAYAAGTIGNFVVPCYYEPTRHIHSTAAALLSRLEGSSREGYVFGGESQPDISDRAVQLSHLLTLNVLELQKEHFRLQELEEPLRICFGDYKEMWFSETGERA